MVTFVIKCAGVPVVTALSPRRLVHATEVWRTRIGGARIPVIALIFCANERRALARSAFRNALIVATMKTGHTNALSYGFFTRLQLALAFRFAGANTVNARIVFCAILSVVARLAVWNVLTSQDRIT